MTKITYLFRAILLSFALLAPSGLIAQTSVSVQDLLEHVRTAINSVNDKAPATDLPSLTRISLTLNTVREVSMTGEIRLLVFTIGHRRSGEFVRTINVDLEPAPRRSSSPDTEPIADVDLADELASAIIEAARAIQDVRIVDSRDRPLVVSRLSATVRFGVTSETGAGIQIVPFSAGANFAQETVQEITVEFGD